MIKYDKCCRCCCWGRSFSIGYDKWCGRCCTHAVPSVLHDMHLAHHSVQHKQLITNLSYFIRKSGPPEHPSPNLSSLLFPSPSFPSSHLPIVLPALPAFLYILAEGWAMGNHYMDAWLPDAPRSVSEAALHNICLPSVKCIIFYENKHRHQKPIVKPKQMSTPPH